MNVTDPLAVLALLGSGITAGVLFGVALSVTPALIAMPVPAYVDAHKKLGSRWDPTMPIIVLTTFLLDIVLAVTSSGAATALYGTGAGLMLGVSAVSHLANVPINKQVKRLSPDDIPEDWQDPRLLWRNWNLLRTVFAGLALLLNALALTTLTA